MTATFFTSDPHFGHTNVLHLCNRPFTTIGEMDEELIERYNATVGRHDTCWFLGDISFAPEPRTRDILARLNGTKRLVFGNHDKKLRAKLDLRRFFDVCLDYAEIYIGEGLARTKVVLCHYPLLTWNAAHHGSIMLHGHCHGTMRYPFAGRILDVGVDVHHYRPISEQAVLDLMLQRPVAIAPDHHSME